MEELEALRITVAEDQEVIASYRQRAEAAEALLRDVLSIFRLAEDGYGEEMLTLDDWGALNPDAAAVIKRVRAHLAGKPEGASDGLA